MEWKKPLVRGLLKGKFFLPDLGNHLPGESGDRV